MLLLNRVLENRKGLPRREYERDREAWRAMHLIGFPLNRDFENVVSLNMIVNCPVTFSDFKNAKLIFGPDITSLKRQISKGAVLVALLRTTLIFLGKSSIRVRNWKS